MILLGDIGSGLVLRDPWLLLVAVLVPLALLWYARRGGPALRFTPTVLLLPASRGGLAATAPLPRSGRLRLRHLPRALQVLGILLFIVALARPAERVPLPRSLSGIDVMLCVDRSSSMTANDLDPARSRLELLGSACGEHDVGRIQCGEVR